MFSTSKVLALRIQFFDLSERINNRPVHRRTGYSKVYCRLIGRDDVDRSGIAGEAAEPQLVLCQGSTKGVREQVQSCVPLKACLMRFFAA
jgi:hypothetical protein